MTAKLASKGWTGYIGIHYLAWGLVTTVYVWAFLHAYDIGSGRHSRCDNLLRTGRWLHSEKIEQWQPEGCMLHPYRAAEVTSCLGQGATISVVGDSLGREVFFSMLRIVAPDIDTMGEKHSNRIFEQGGLHWQFIWDPYLNSTMAESITRPVGSNPGLVVLSTGLWYLNRPESGGQAAFREQMAHLQNNIVLSNTTAFQNWIVMMPVEDPIEARLSIDRASRLDEGEIGEMNQFLLSRASYYHVPTAFNSMLVDPGHDLAVQAATEDGIHFVGAIGKARANILLNLRCNNVLPKHFPMDKTCCMQYSRPNFVQLTLLGFFLVWIPLGLAIRYLNDKSARTPSLQRVSALFPTGSALQSWFIFGGCCALIFLADRTDVFSKEDKVWNPWHFALLSILALTVGLGTLQTNEKDSSFLNRDQTDEWKGWMQIAILIYHYVGASRISPIYNSIRAVVAAYLFMTGYGHFTYWYKKKDFGYARIFSSLVRLNLLTIVLAYLMDTDFMFYYFSPLVSFWFLVIYATMGIGSRWNEHDLILLAKIMASALIVAFLYHQTSLMEYLFVVLKVLCKIDWNAREWSFRIGLDQWIVYVGMLTAFAVIKAQKMKISDSPRWLVYKSSAIVLASISLALYLVGESFYSKFDYNVYQPYVSMIPILGFMVLRNSTALLRSRTSQFFTFFGRCSLETFIVQFHLWLAADTKGILIVIPLTTYRSVNFVISTCIFVYISYTLAQTTTQLTAWISQVDKKTAVGEVAVAPLPLTAMGPLDGRNAAGSDPVMAVGPASSIANGALHEADQVALLSGRNNGEEDEIEVVVSDELDISEPAGPSSSESARRGQRRRALQAFYDVYIKSANDLKLRSIYILFGLWVLNMVY